MSLLSPEKLSSIQSAIQKAHTSPSVKKYCIQTFGCQMNHADSEKIHMLLSQAGLVRVEEWHNDVDIVIFNTCSVRQKSEDKVFGYIEEIQKIKESTGRNILVGMTGCMTRKTGINKKYYNYR
jgi:tRNA-2-methylthio-N6-dimethylallyladenosine synthase